MCFFFVVVVVYFIKYLPFLFLLILMDNVLNPGLCSCQVCPGGEVPPPPTSGFMFGSSLEPSLEAGPCCQGLPSVLFLFFLPSRVYRNVLQRIRSALSCVLVWFLPLLENQSMRKGRSCYVCAAHELALCRCKGVMCTHTCVEMGYAAPHFSPSPGFPIHAVRDLI